LKNFNKLFCRQCLRYDCFLHDTNHHPPKLESQKQDDINLDLSSCTINCCFRLESFQKILLKLRESIKSSNMKSTTKLKSTDHLECSSSSSSNYSEDSNKSKQNSTNSSSNDENIYFTDSYTHHQFELNKDQNSNLINWTIGKDSTNICDCGEWTDDERLMVKCLLGVYKCVKKFCFVAEALQSKCCLHVHDYCANILKINDDEPGIQSVNMKKTSSRSDTSSRGRKKKPKSYFISKTFREQVKEDDTNVFQYVPCDHPGRSCNEDCICLKSNGFCEKYCKCDSNCPQRFQGCKCKQKCITNSCACYLGKRECDPDLCGTCGASNFDISTIKCKNVCVQKRLKKHLLLAPSDVAGFGIFAKDRIQKNEFISEYCGELITQTEAEKRGTVYDVYKCSFLFNLNNDYTIDATRKGNKIRFANHSKNPNCNCKVLTINGERRIAVFAKRDIEAGEELFLDYRYGLNEQYKYVPIEKQS